jgi:hypothetical protein
MKIIPNNNSAVSRIDMTLDFSDYNGSTSIFSVPTSSTPFSAAASTSAPTSANQSLIQVKDSQRKADLASIAKGLESFHSVQGRYPQTNGTEKISATSGILFTALVPTYLVALPLDPNDPTNYYGYVSDGVTYTLSSVLEDKTDAAGKQVGNNFLYLLSNL